MAYKYFSQKLLASDILDLSTVFPEQQEASRVNNNVNYTLADIVMFLRDATEDFKFADNNYIDLDSAISEIVDKYYKSIGEKNPFKVVGDEEALKAFEDGTIPREAVVVEDGKSKGRGLVKPAKINKVGKTEKTEEPSVPEKVEEPTPAAVAKADDVKVQQFKATIENLQFLLDDSDADEKADILKSQSKRADDLEFFIDDAGEGEDVTLEKEKLALIREFVSKNSK